MWFIPNSAQVTPIGATKNEVLIYRDEPLYTMIKPIISTDIKWDGADKVKAIVG